MCVYKKRKCLYIFLLISDDNSENLKARLRKKSHLLWFIQKFMSSFGDHWHMCSWNFTFYLLLFHLNYSLQQKKKLNESRPRPWFEIHSQRLSNPQQWIIIQIIWKVKTCIVTDVHRNTGVNVNFLPRSNIFSSPI